MDGCRTTTDAADDYASNDVNVKDADEFDVVGRYARYDEVWSIDCDLLLSLVNHVARYTDAGRSFSLSLLLCSLQRSTITIRLFYLQIYQSE